MKNEAREAIAGMRKKLDSIALSMDMIDTDDGWEYDKPAIRDRVWESTPSLLLHDLVSLATRIEDLESDLQTLESIEDNDLMEHAYKSSAELATDRVRTLTEVEGPFRSEDC